MNQTRLANAGLSWPEVLFFISIVLVFASILIPAFMSMQKRNRSIQAFAEMKILISAANRFNNEYRLWPVYDPPQRGDARYGDQKSNAAVFRILNADEGIGNEGHKSNPARINFIELATDGPRRLQLNNRGEMVDPWGSPYQLVFDSNYDSICSVENTMYGQIIGEGVLVWSKGADRRSDTGDDLTSWIR